MQCSTPSNYFKIHTQSNNILI